jgi:hypothetical protein
MRRPVPDLIGSFLDAILRGPPISQSEPLSIERVRRIISRIEYKPGWVISADILGQASDYPRVALSYDMPTVDRDTNESTHLTFTFTHDPFVAEDQLVDTVMRHLLTVEEHEACEFFVYDGERVFDPHKEEW